MFTVFGFLKKHKKTDKCVQCARQIPHGHIGDCSDSSLQFSSISLRGPADFRLDTGEGRTLSSCRQMKSSGEGFEIGETAIEASEECIRRFPRVRKKEKLTNRKLFRSQKHSCTTCTFKGNLKKIKKKSNTQVNPSRSGRRRRIFAFWVHPRTLFCEHPVLFRIAYRHSPACLYSLGRHVLLSYSVTIIMYTEYYYYYYFLPPEECGLRHS